MALFGGLGDSYGLCSWTWTTRCHAMRMKFWTFNSFFPLTSTLRELDYIDSSQGVLLIVCIITGFIHAQMLIDFLNNGLSMPTADEKGFLAQALRLPRVTDELKHLGNVTGQSTLPRTPLCQVPSFLGNVRHAMLTMSHIHECLFYFVQFLLLVNNSIA